MHCANLNAAVHEIGVTLVECHITTSGIVGTEVLLYVWTVPPDLIGMVDKHFS